MMETLASSQQQNLQAKQKAMLALEDVWINPVSVVSYQSKGFVLIISNSTQQAQQIATKLSDDFTIHHLVDTSQKNVANTDDITYGSITRVDGYLGSFGIEALINNKLVPLTATPQGKRFDIIINLLSKPKLAPVLPFGYYALNQQIINLDLLDEINSLIGILDKPKFINLDTTICVHNRNKIQLCQRCIDVCPAQAISSNGNDSVDVNLYLCHGCGGCSSACPTGAISYAYPSIEDNEKKIYTLVNQYLLADGKQPRLLFYSQQEESKNLISKLTKLDTCILPLAVEEIGYLGLEVLLYAFCLGVEEVFIYHTDKIKQTERELRRQINLIDGILQSLGYQDKKSYVKLIKTLPTASKIKPISLNKTIGLLDLANKRNRIFAMIDFLYAHEQTRKSPSQYNFNPTDDAFFGEIIIDKSLCTLCMACTSICPPKALSSGNLNKPIINFQENLCVQCSLCAKSCPEHAIKLNTRLLYDNKQRTKKITLNEDEPFSCIECGKVFGSNQIIQKMIGKLKNHPMFLNEKLTNLERCEDCRVKALFNEPYDDI